MVAMAASIATGVTPTGSPVIAVSVVLYGPVVATSPNELSPVRTPARRRRGRVCVRCLRRSLRAFDACGEPGYWGEAVLPEASGERYWKSTGAERDAVAAHDQGGGSARGQIDDQLRRPYRPTVLRRVVDGWGLEAEVS